MSRRDFVRRIAEDWAAFAADVAAHHAPTPPAPLDREYAFGVGRRLILAGEYRPRVRSLDYGRVAREARRVLPAAERLIAEVRAEYPEHACRACGARLPVAS